MAYSTPSFWNGINLVNNFEGRREAISFFGIFIFPQSAFGIPIVVGDIGTTVVWMCKKVVRIRIPVSLITPGHPKTLRDSIISIFNLLHERVDDVLVLIYSIKVMCLYLFACIFSILE